MTSKKAKKRKTSVTEAIQKDPTGDITTGTQVFTTILEKGESPHIVGPDSRFVVVSVLVFLLIFFVLYYT